MRKAVLLAAAAALAISGSVFARGGAKTGASANAYIDRNAQISANDCQMLSVDSARNACMRHAQASGGAHVGATSDSGRGMGQGGHPMRSGSSPESGMGSDAHMRGAHRSMNR